MPLKLLPFIFLGLLTLGKGKPLASNKTAFDVVHSWKYVEFEFDSAARKDKLLNTSYYDKANMAIFDVDLAKDGRTFVIVLPRRGKLPSVNTISEKKGKGGPLLKPFPDWNWHSRNDCIGIFRALRIKVDDCNRLWVLDTGTTHDERLKCPPQLLLFDLASNKLISRISIPKKFFHARDGEGYVADLLVQTEGWWCQNSMVFMSYYKSEGLLVWNGEKMWRLNGPNNRYLSGRFKMGRRGLDSNGIFGFALSPKIGNNSQIIALRSLGTQNMYTAKVDDILETTPKDPDLNRSFLDIFNVFKAAKKEPPKLNDNSTIKYQLYLKPLPNPVASQVFNKAGILFMGVTYDTAIACWNSAKNLTKANVDIIDKDKDVLSFVSGAKVFQSDKTGGEEELWINIANYDDYEYQTMDFSKINYRILKSTTKRILTNSKCL